MKSPSLPDLEHIKPFSLLSPDERTGLAEVLERIDAKPGKFILREGSDENNLLFLVQGKVKVCRADRSGKEVILALLGPGDVIGEIALLTGSKRSADVVALTECVLLSISHENFYGHLQRFSGLSVVLLRYMARRVNLATERITDLALYDVTCRVARVIYEMSIVTRLEEQELHVVNEPPTHQALASMVGASREAVTRAFQVLEKEGHIECDDERILIHSLPSF